jgi:hypothetical protein
MKRIVKSRLDDHVLDLYNRVDDVKKDVSVIKNNHLKHMSCAIYKIEKKVDWIQKAMLTGMGALALTLIAILFKLK